MRTLQFVGAQLNDPMAPPPAPMTPLALRLRPRPAFIFVSRWLQPPLCLGLILHRLLKLSKTGAHRRHLPEGGV
jgi:hypothetical protein